MNGEAIPHVKRALSALGTMWRNDWSDFDGRTLRAQLDDIAKVFDAPDPEAAADALIADYEESSAW